MSKANIDIIILDEIDSTNNEAQRVLNYKSIAILTAIL